MKQILRYDIKKVWLLLILIGYGTGGYPQEAAETMSDREVYELLWIRYTIYKEYNREDVYLLPVVTEASRYAQEGDYRLARLYLEEVLAQIMAAPDTSRHFTTPLRNLFGETMTARKLEITVSSGIDFNRQEFEIGFLDDDSTVLEEINKPFIGLAARYPFYRRMERSLEISNSLRLDRFNWRDEYEIRWRSGNEFTAAVGGFWNQSEELEAASFWEHHLDLSWHRIESPSLIWKLRENYAHKSYREHQAYLADFYRNRLNAGVEWMLAEPLILELDFLQELNESLGSENLDYFQNGLSLGGHGPFARPMDYSLNLTAQRRDYSIVFEDSLVQNSYQEWSLESALDFRLSDWISLELRDDLSQKIYTRKSALEPDYFWNYLRPALTVSPWRILELGIGYEWEIKDNFNGSDPEYDVNEQDYRADGLFLNLSIYTATGIYFNGTASYQWRRYPISATNEIFTIYSDRNVLSIFLNAFVPVSDHLSVNAFAAYDNDEDVDLDQQNNQSVIFNLEVGYMF